MVFWLQYSLQKIVCEILSSAWFLSEGLVFWLSLPNDKKDGTPIQKKLTFLRFFRWKLTVFMTNGLKQIIISANFSRIVVEEREVAFFFKWIWILS